MSDATGPAGGGKRPAAPAAPGSPGSPGANARAEAREEVEVDVSDLAEGAMKPVDVRGTSVLVCRVDGAFHAVENLCSHAAVPLDEGRLEGCELECVLHGAVFDVRTGEALALPARDPIRRFDLRRDGDRVFVRVPPRAAAQPRPSSRARNPG